jgi:hypothetical protein
MSNTIPYFTVYPLSYNLNLNPYTFYLIPRIPYTFDLPPFSFELSVLR